MCPASNASPAKPNRVIDINAKITRVWPRDRLRWIASGPGVKAISILRVDDADGRDRERRYDARNQRHQWRPLVLHLHRYVTGRLRNAPRVSVAPGVLGNSRGDGRPHIDVALAG